MRTLSGVWNWDVELHIFTHTAPFHVGTTLRPWVPAVRGVHTMWNSTSGSPCSSLELTSSKLWNIEQRPRLSTAGNASRHSWSFHPWYCWGSWTGRNNNLPANGLEIPSPLARPKSGHRTRQQNPWSYFWRYNGHSNVHSHTWRIFGPIHQGCVAVRT